MKHLPHLIVTCAFALLLSRAPASAGAPPPGALKVVAVASTDKVRLNESFKLMVRVKNTTAVPQHITVMSCSWYDSYQADNRAISRKTWGCTRNGEVDVTIAPGEAYTRELDIFFLSAADMRMFATMGRDATWAKVKPVTAGPLSFKMGFTPAEGAKPCWSNAIKIEVLDHPFPKKTPILIAPSNSHQQS